MWWECLVSLSKRVCKILHNSWDTLLVGHMPRVWNRPDIFRPIPSWAECLCTGPCIPCRRPKGASKSQGFPLLFPCWLSRCWHGSKDNSSNSEDLSKQWIKGNKHVTWRTSSKNLETHIGLLQVPNTLSTLKTCVNDSILSYFLTLKHDILLYYFDNILLVTMVTEKGNIGFPARARWTIYINCSLEFLFLQLGNTSSLKPDSFDTFTSCNEDCRDGEFWTFNDRGSGIGDL